MARMFRKRFLHVLLGTFFLSFLFGTPALAWHPKPPPPGKIRVVVHGKRVRVWIPGHWTAHSWVPGHWVPRPDAVWIPGHWGPGGRWIPGHWHWK